MNPVISNLLGLISTLFIGWLRALIAFLVRIQAILRSALDGSRLKGREAKTADTDCVPIRHPSFRRPDPMLYSQPYLMGLGLAVSWDNPDIELRRGGAAISSDAVEADTEYEIVARIWNGSTNAPVVGMPVLFSYLSFGIGTPSTPIGTSLVDLGVKGGPGCPAFAVIPWRTPAEPGHYCIQVQLVWSDDTNPLNNLGQENLSIQPAQSPAAFSFAIRNPDERHHRFSFSVDGYAIPEQLACEAVERPGRRELYRRSVQPAAARLTPQLGEDIRRRHDRSAYPLPDGWAVQFEPSEVELNAGEQAAVRVSVKPPPGFQGRQPVNVHVADGDKVTGGVTLIVEAA
jgi:hypothetical protein